jgi:drug/metabolite transporter (DMT)-like permease
MTVSDRVVRRPALGYVLAASGATLWALNGNLARYLLDDGVSAIRLAQLRSAGSWLILLVLLFFARRDLLGVERRELPALAFLGVVGLAMVHATYFVAIQRLQIGVAVTIEYLAPLLLLLWLRIAHGRQLRPSLWGAVGLSIVGCFLVVRAYDAGSLDGLGVAAAFGAAVSFAVYLVGSERAGRNHEPVTTLFWSFGFASLLWVVAAPWWSFPFSKLASLTHLLLAAGVVVVGTLVPFICMVAALRHIPAPRAAVVATLEPALAAVFAWFLHDERLAALQIAGGIAVIAAVILVQSRRPDLEAELAPPWPDGSARRRRERAKQRI